MMAGGTGITPMLQVIQAVLMDPQVSPTGSRSVLARSASRRTWCGVRSIATSYIARCTLYGAERAAAYAAPAWVCGYADRALARNSLGAALRCRAHSGGSAKGCE